LLFLEIPEKMIQAVDKVYISSKDNPNIKLYKKLAAEKKSRTKTGLFVLEGMRICVDTLAESREGNVEVEALFYTREALEKYAGYLPVGLIEDFDEDKKFEIPEELADKLSSESSNQGAFIIAKKTDKPLAPESLNAHGKYLVLDFVQDPGNLGTLIRTADAVGVDGVVLTNNCCDLYNPKVVRSTMGSMPRMNIYIENDFEKAAEILGSVGIRLAAAVVGSGISITEYDFSKPCAVVIGNEGRGLSEEHIALCDDRITIRMNGHINSLNAASAGTIMLWEMTRGKGGLHE
jgi:TrmH family RNA methyltransferase